MSQSRTQRIEETLRRAIADVLLFGGLRDPRLGEATISVTGVKVTPDLAQARIFVDVLGDDDHKRQVLTALRAATRVIRGEIASRVQLRRIPAIEFAIDSAIERGLRIEAVIAEIHAQDAHRSAEPTETETETETETDPHRAGDTSGAGEADEPGSRGTS